MKANSIFFDKLKRTGFIKNNGEVNLSKIINSKIDAIIDVASDTSALTKHLNDSNNSRFVHSASISLGAGRHPCENLECRLKKANQLSQFAALYSDRVYILNYFSDYQHMQHDEQGLRHGFYNDLTILTRLRPLIDEGRVFPFTPPNLCPKCFFSKSLGPDTERRFNKEFKKLLKKCLEQITCTAESISIEGLPENTVIVNVKGPEDLIEHGRYTIVPHHSSPQELAIKELMKNSARIELSKQNIQKLDIHTDLANYISTNVKLELFTSQAFQASFLTESDVQIRILNGLSENRSVIKRNAIIEKHLTSLVPFISNIDPADLIKLRQREYESFVIFRESLNRAIVECKNYEQGFSETIAKQIYSDLIFPQLTRLDLKVKAAKRDLIKSTRRKTLAWAGAISFGIYSGLLSAELAATASALGLSKVIADLLEMTMMKSDTVETIKNEDIYFLWKVREISKTKQN